MATKIIWQSAIALVLLFFASPPIKSFYFGAGFRGRYIFIFSFLAAYFVTPFCRHIALKLNILDKPDWRKIHDRPTPLLGGLGVYIAFSASLLLNGVFLPGMKTLLFGATLIFLMGLADDIRPLPALLRLLLQILISLLVVLCGDIQLSFFFHASWAPLVNIPLTVLWIVGITNAMNFFDGVDGLAASLSIIGAFFLGIIAFNTYQPALGWFAVALLGSCLGFMPHNFRVRESALLFLGDAGSNFLGFALAGLAVMGHWSTTSQFVSLTAPILIFGVLIFDMIYVSLSRIKNRQAKNLLELLTRANKDHLHHRLIFMGFARKEVVLIISTMAVCLGVSALIMMNQVFIDAILGDAILGLFQAVLIFGLIVALMLKGRESASPLGNRDFTVTQPGGLETQGEEHRKTPATRQETEL